jgi:hypothetical protein
MMTPDARIAKLLHGRHGDIYRLDHQQLVQLILDVERDTLARLTTAADMPERLVIRTNVVRADDPAQ